MTSLMPSATLSAVRQALEVGPGTATTMYEMICSSMQLWVAQLYQLLKKHYKLLPKIVDS